MINRPIQKLPTALPASDRGEEAASLYLYVPDCDGVYDRAMGAGGKSMMPPTTMPSGARYGGVMDPSGNIWWIATRVEDILPEEQARRWADFDQES